MMRSFAIAALTLTLSVGTTICRAADAPAQDASDPSKLIEDCANRMLKDLDAHRAEYRKDPAKINKLVDEVLLPHFDTQYAARLVLGRYWRDASQDQRQRFIDAFYKSLLENYGSALAEFTADRMKVLPFQGDATSDRATVRTEVKRSDGTRVPVNYSMRKTDEGWKAWDVSIEGISYVKNFRTQYGAEIDEKGLEAVIKRLETEGVKTAPTSKTPPAKST
jgi:phospholipid transport system substrate-binding protein